MKKEEEKVKAMARVNPDSEEKEDTTRTLPKCLRKRSRAYTKECRRPKDEARARSQMGPIGKSKPSTTGPPSPVGREDLDDSRTRQDLMASPWSVGAVDRLSISTTIPGAQLQVEARATGGYCVNPAIADTQALTTTWASTDAKS